jgi:hypothetical protein
MPARDGTGPLGQGARTGRGMGNCQQTRQPALSSGTRAWWNPLRWFGGKYRTGTDLGFGTGRGMGRGGRGRW